MAIEIKDVVQVLGGGVLGYCLYLLKRSKERASEKDDLDIEIKKVDLETKRLQHQRLLDQNNQAPADTNEIRAQIDKVFTDGREQDSYSASEVSMTCMLFAEHGVGRAECIADYVGDVILNISGGDASQTGDHYNVILSLNVNCTNRIASDKSLDVLWMDSSSDQASKPGYLEYTNRVVFRNVLIKPPGIANLLQYRISNLRVNISQLGIPDGGGFPATRIYAFVSIEPVARSLRRIALANHMLDLSSAILGCITTGSNSYTYMPSRQGSMHEDLLDAEIPRLNRIPLYMSLREGFYGAFRTREQESGLPNIAPATAGTRFLARFYNVPDDVTVFVTLTDVPFEAIGSSFRGDKRGLPRSEREEIRAVIVDGVDGQGANGRVSTPVSHENFEGYDLLRLSHSGGFATCTWEWVGSEGDDSEPRTVCFGIVVASHGDSPCMAGAAQVAIGLAPVSTVSGASSNEPVPRFVDCSGSPRTFFVQLNEPDDDEL